MLGLLSNQASKLLQFVGIDRSVVEQTEQDGPRGPIEYAIHHIGQDPTRDIRLVDARREQKRPTRLDSPHIFLANHGIESRDDRGVSQFAPLLPERLPYLAH